MTNVSLCMIVKDEARVLARCLESVKDCVDEIIIVDTGSTDETVEIAERYTDRIFDFAWTDDFSAARNFAFSKGTGDYLLWLDADDVLPAEEKPNLLKLKETLTAQKPDVVFCPYDVAFDQTGVATTFRRERLVKRSAGFVWQGCVHECIAPSGKILQSNVRIRHLGSDKVRGDRNLRIYERFLTRGGTLSPRDRFYYARELYYHRLYEQAIAMLNPLFSDRSAWYVNVIEGCKIAAYCYMELGRSDEAEETLLKSLRYGEPRASVLVEIGTLLRKKNRLRECIFWLTSALFCRDHSAEGDFDSPHDRFLRPLLELTCCYYALGETGKAVSCHKQLKSKFPDHPSVLYNEKFFRERGLL